MLVLLTSITPTPWRYRSLECSCEYLSLAKDRSYRVSFPSHLSIGLCTAILVCLCHVFNITLKSIVSGFIPQILPLVYRMCRVSFPSFLQKEGDVCPKSINRPFVTGTLSGFIPQILSLVYRLSSIVYRMCRVSFPSFLQKEGDVWRCHKSLNRPFVTRT